MDVDSRASPPHHTNLNEKNEECILAVDVEYISIIYTTDKQTSTVKRNVMQRKNNSTQKLRRQQKAAWPILY